MTTMSPAAVKAREDARQHGQFGTQTHADPGLVPISREVVSRNIARIEAAADAAEAIEMEKALDSFDDDPNVDVWKGFINQLYLDDSATEMVGGEPAGTFVTQDMRQFQRNPQTGQWKYVGIFGTAYGEASGEKPVENVTVTGARTFTLHGKLHNPDGPAIILPDGTERWYLNDQRHRLDGPAETSPDGTQTWCVDGEEHRDGAPSTMGPNGHEEWRVHGKLDRADGPAYTADGVVGWYRNDRVHRVGAPALTYADGTQVFMQNNVLHNPDGPAVIHPNGTLEYWIDGQSVPAPAGTRGPADGYLPDDDTPPF